MASEAEIERLYQLFVTNGGGALSFSGANLTPKQYSDAVAISIQQTKSIRCNFR